MSSFARLSPLAKGRIIGLREANVKRPEIRKRVRKKDGKRPSLQGLDGVLERYEEDLGWDGIGDARFVGCAPVLHPGLNQGLTRA